MTRTHRVMSLTVASLMAMALMTPAALATPPEHVLQRARDAVDIGREKAQGMAAEAPGQENRAKGLEQAAAAIAAAAERKAARTGGEVPGNAFGRGHSADVHAYLLAGKSPSDLPPHSDQVRTLVEAFKALKSDRPGLGLGRDKHGDD